MAPLSRVDHAERPQVVRPGDAQHVEKLRRIFPMASLIFRCETVERAEIHPGGMRLIHEGGEILGEARRGGWRGQMRGLLQHGAGELGQRHQPVQRFDRRRQRRERDSGRGLQPFARLGQRPHPRP